MRGKRNVYCDASGNIRGVIYRYTNNVPDDAEYGYSWIGNTMNEKLRRRSWNNKGNHNYGGTKINGARERIGKKNFSYQVLEEHFDTDEKRLQSLLDEREAYYIKLYDALEHGYNASSGGSGSTGVKMSAESIAKRNATRKKNGVNYAHTPSKYKGQKRDQEFCEAVSAGLKDKQKSEAHKKALSESLTGRELTLEWIENIRKARKGKPHPLSAQGIANINAARYKVPVIATNDKTGYHKEFESMKAVEKELGVKPGSVHNFLKTGNANKDGYRFAYKGGVKPLPKKKQKP